MVLGSVIIMRVLTKVRSLGSQFFARVFIAKVIFMHLSAMVYLIHLPVCSTFLPLFPQINCNLIFLNEALWNGFFCNLKGILVLAMIFHDVWAQAF